MALVLLANQGTHLTCEDAYHIPPEVSMQIAQQEGVVQIQSKDPQGYIREMFVGRMFFEGVFILDEGQLIACHIGKVILLTKEGKIEFLYFDTQKAM